MIRVFSNLKRPHLDRRRSAAAGAFDSRDCRPAFPRNALVEVSNACNHACVFCTNPRMRREKRTLSLETFRRFVGEAVQLGLEELGLYSTGEPFMVKRLERYVETAAQAGVSYIYLTTNGALATPERTRAVIDAGLSSMKFSINAGSRESYRLVHGRDDFTRVLDNLTFISDYRKRESLDLLLLASCVVTRFVEDEVETLRELLLPLVDEVMFVGVTSQAGQSLGYLEALTSSMSDAPRAPGERAEACGMLWNRVHLTAEGYLSLCCVDYENTLTYADLNREDLAQAWHNQIITQMRQRQRSQQLDGTLCRTCLYGDGGPVRPISEIGHGDPALPILSDDPRGTRSVENRMAELEAGEAAGTAAAGGGGDGGGRRGGGGGDRP